MIYFICNSILLRVKNLDLQGKTCLLLYQNIVDPISYQSYQQTLPKEGFLSS